MQSDVLIVGAGPTGLVLALWLNRLGVRVRLVDKTDAPGTTSRALADATGAPEGLDRYSADRRIRPAA